MMCRAIKHSTLCLLILVLSALPLAAQTHSSANNLFQEGDYLAAQQAYGALLKSYPTNPLYLYRYARCAQELGDLFTAIQYFDKAGDRYVLKYFYLGEIYMQLWRADDAINAYTTYLNTLREPNEREPYIQSQIDRANKLRRYLRRVERLQVIDSVCVTLDSMLHVCHLSAEAGQLTWDLSHGVIYTNQRGDRRLQAVSSDSAQVIVSSHRLLEEEWMPFDTLPEVVNFSSHQTSPYLLNDGVTLYFASNDTNGLGGMDIYVTRYNTTTETYTIPENLGMPYNSPANEYMLLMDETRHVGYLATDRFAPSGRVHIYSFMIPDSKSYYEPSDSLAAYARLAAFDRAEMPDLPSVMQVVETESVNESADFCFIVNDSIIYHSINDFRNAAAKEKYHAWQKTFLQYQTEQQQLLSLRQQYATADEATQKELTPAILHLENNQSQLQVQCEQLLQSIRRIEMENNQQ